MNPVTILQHSLLHLCGLPSRHVSVSSSSACTGGHAACVSTDILPVKPRSPRKQEIARMDERERVDLRLVAPQDVLWCRCASLLSHRRCRRCHLLGHRPSSPRPEPAKDRYPVMLEGSSSGRAGSCHSSRESPGIVTWAVQAVQPRKF